MRTLMTLSAANMLSPHDRVYLALLRTEAQRQAALREGDFVECGVFRGGSALLLAHALKSRKSPYTVHLLDAWRGLPKPTEHDQGTALRGGEFYQASEGNVRRMLTRRTLIDRCTFHPGWFSHTLPKLPGPFSFAHIDCGLYASTKTCLIHLLPRMSARGIVIVHGNSNCSGVQGAIQECLSSVSDWKMVPLSSNSNTSVKLERT